MSEATIHTLEALLDASLPEFMSFLRAQTEWGWEEDDEGRVFLALEYLRTWLLGPAGDAAPRAWGAGGRRGAAGVGGRRAAGCDARCRVAQRPRRWPPGGLLVQAHLKLMGVR